MNQPSRERSRTGGRSAAPLLLAIVVLAGAVGWMLFGRGSRPELTPRATEPREAARANASPATPPAEATPNIEKSRDSDPRFSGAMNQAATLKVKDRKTGKFETRPIHTLEGKVLDDRDESPVYLFKAWMIPEDAGDPQVAKNTYSPNHMRNGVLHLENQVEGRYHLIVESREHESVTRFVEVPFEGELIVRLKHGTSVRGVVRDSFQQPVANVDVQLNFDPARIDPGFTPPLQRLAKTDANGRYFFWKLPPGTYSVRATLFGDTLADEPEFRLDPGNEVLRDFMIEPFGSIRVVITNPVDQPLARAKATLYSTLPDGRDRVVRNGLSDLKGFARLEFVREGSYKLKVSVPGFVPHEQTVVVAAGDPSRDIPVRLEIAPTSGG